MISVLYISHLVLATASKGSANFDIAAVVPLQDTAIEEPDNGRGKPTAN